MQPSHSRSVSRPSAIPCTSRSFSRRRDQPADAHLQFVESESTFAYFSATAEALHAICDLDLSDIESVEPPRGYGRDATSACRRPDPSTYRARWRPLVKKQRVRLQASMPADVGRALRYAGGFAPARRPTPTDSDISKWQKQ
jgi:hypothetical protein